jgi:two-component system NtrC family sensor kinase
LFNELQRAFDRSFVDLGVVDHQGRQIAYAGPLELTGVDYSSAEWFKQAISNPFLSVTSSKECVVHPILSYRCDKSVTAMPWILRATIDFGEFNNLVEFLTHW